MGEKGPIITGALNGAEPAAWFGMILLGAAAEVPWVDIGPVLIKSTPTHLRDA